MVGADFSVLYRGVAILALVVIAAAFGAGYGCGHGCGYRLRLPVEKVSR